MNSSNSSNSPNSEISLGAYRELRAVALNRLRAHGGSSLQPTELVHEAWARLQKRGHHWKSRTELFGLAARAMRDLLVERARKAATAKRGGDWKQVEWESALRVASDHPEEMLMLDEALSRLSIESPQSAQIVEMMFYAGFTGEETAQALGISASTVDRRWAAARAWLRAELIE